MRPGLALEADRPGHRTPVGGWRPIVLQAAGMWLATRVSFAVLTYVTVIFNGFGNTRVPPGFVVGRWDLGTLLGSWGRWDAGIFVDISQNGYHSRPHAAFFPLYPMLIRLATTVAGQRYALLAALLISNLAALAGFIGLALLAAHEDGPGAAPGAVRALAAYPLAFFLAAPYSDALLLATATFTLLWARQGAWKRTAVAAFLAALTRSSALILVLPLVWEYGRQHGWWERERWRTFRPRRLLNIRGGAEAIMVLGALPLGLAVYVAYLWRQFGEPLLFLRAHALYWNRHLEPVWVTLRHALGMLVRTPLGTYWSVLIALDLGALLAFGVLTVVVLRRQPVSFTLYMAGLLFLSTAAPTLLLPDPLSSVGRELLVAIPVFLLLGRWLRRWPALDLLIVAGGFMLQAALTTYFLSGGWVE